MKFITILRSSKTSVICTYLKIKKTFRYKYYKTINFSETEFHFNTKNTYYDLQFKLFTNYLF